MEKALIFIGVILQKKEKKPLGNYYTYRKMNVYNPLTYILIVLLFPIAVVRFGLKETIESIRKEFKWS